jgi:hypothetical protein
MRAVSVLTVVDETVWAELAAVVSLEEHLGESLGPLSRVVEASFERSVLPKLRDRLLIRYARRDAEQALAAQSDIAVRIAGLPRNARTLLVTVQRHALDNVVIGRQAWDPMHDANAVRALHGEGLIVSFGDEAEAFTGRYRLNPDLPPPPEVDYHFDEAAMDETDDLGEPVPGLVSLLHDMASLAAALEQVPTQRTLKGTIAKTAGKKLGKRLGDSLLGSTGDFEGNIRWARALRGLEALKVVSTDPIRRDLHLDNGLEATLAGDVEDACDRLVHRLVDADLHVVLPAIRTALAQAGKGAVDEMVFLEELAEQHRDVLISPWSRDGELVYPVIGEEQPRPYDEDGWEYVERRMVRATLGRLKRFGLIRRAPGVFAATDDGRQWATGAPVPMPPVWVTGDLELVVPPGSVTPWERFQLERLGRCLQRDVVDRYRLERKGVVTWLSTHDLSEAIDLLTRRCPGVPGTAIDALTQWARSAERAVLTRGVLLEESDADVKANSAG